MGGRDAAPALSFSMRENLRIFGRCGFHGCVFGFWPVSRQGRRSHSRDTSLGSKIPKKWSNCFGRERVDCVSDLPQEDQTGQEGRSLFVTAGVAALRRGLQKGENAVLGCKMPFQCRNYLYSLRWRSKSRFSSRRRMVSRLSCLRLPLARAIRSLTLPSRK